MLVGDRGQRRLPQPKRAEDFDPKLCGKALKEVGGWTDFRLRGKSEMLKRVVDELDRCC